jgi:hypothetical protein
VDAEYLVEFGHEAGGQLADALADALDGNRSDLLGKDQRSCSVANHRSASACGVRLTEPARGHAARLGSSSDPEG